LFPPSLTSLRTPPVQLPQVVATAIIIGNANKWPPGGSLSKFGSRVRRRAERASRMVKLQAALAAWRLEYGIWPSGVSDSRVRAPAPLSESRSPHAPFEL
jgi:hypothetical protein